MISEHSDHDALAARLAAIDAQPLEDRAAAFSQLSEELRARLDGTGVIDDVAAASTFATTTAGVTA
ncbi:hypothetical protein D6T64_01910 [Cryobacterium melibiosiphilum]|uniref:Uncharacterized protein n=1 Tax=Cryobacterium melibiosiphilum TaxID=995039 RepID=A0A3A5MVU9_9MICO|nr:hypothetical protein [Cryobacterium melibiosiphilum]RJT91328.1 hypothetical protein D6T64_01910 [Cryobacterium melibiosiphilum]